MKYRTLLTGKNSTVLNNFFTLLSNSFECLSTTVFYDDISNHIKYFKPEVFIYAPGNESEIDMRKMISIKNNLLKGNTPFILIGSLEECNTFKGLAGDIADLTLSSDLSTSDMEKQITLCIKRINPSAGSSENDPLPIDSLLPEKKVKKEKAAKDENRRKHILVVDDDPQMLKVIKSHLAEHYDIATAINGRLALDFLQTKRTDLILLDYQMPEENGPAILEKLRRNEATRDIPVVFLTGISDRNKISQALALKPQGYLLKPIDHIKLLYTIKNLLS